MNLALTKETRLEKFLIEHPNYFENSKPRYKYRIHTRTNETKPIKQKVFANCTSCKMSFWVRCWCHKICKECARNRQNTKRRYPNDKNLTRLYRILSGLRTRCTYPAKHNYANYGGRGITYCERWKHFKNFRQDMEESYRLHIIIHGERDTTLDRINPDGNYEPSNCRWATRSEQSINTSKTKTHLLTNKKQ